MYTAKLTVRSEIRTKHAVAIGGGGLRQNTTVLYPIYYADDDMFRPLWAIFRAQNVYRGKLYIV